MKVKKSLIYFICLSLLIRGSFTHASVMGFTSYNLRLRRVLGDIRELLPVNMIMTSMEEYLNHAEEFTYDLESCYINLKGSLNLHEKEDFVEHQKVCLNNFLNFFSIFEIIKAIVNKFFIESCPDDLADLCEEKAKDFFDLAEKIDLSLVDFAKELVHLDSSVKQLKDTFSELKPDNVKRVVMNAILVINKENFYTQLNDVLDSKDEELAAEEVSGDKPELQVGKKVKSSRNYVFEGGLKDDPFQNPDRYFLSEPGARPLEDLHIIFTTDSNDSDLVN